jgi:DNA gyrase subunit A
MVALEDGQPKLLDLKQVLEAFLKHRREVVTRRTLFELRKARERAHILEGQAVALANIDEVIALIKASPTPAEAKEGLMSRAWAPGAVTGMLERAGVDASRPEGLPEVFGLLSDGYHLSDAQAQAILDLRLHRLTGLEQDKIITEYKELMDKIDDLLDILSNPGRLMQVIRDELVALQEQYGDKRRTEIIESHLNLSLEDLIGEEDVVVTLSHAGYVKAQQLTEYQAQRRGGRGKAAARVKDEDFIEKLFIANTHDTILCFSSEGKVYWLKVYELPLAARTARGRPIINLLPLTEGEQIQAILPVREYQEDLFIVMATRNGTIKKTPLTAFSNPRSNGIIALDIRDGDRLIGVALTDGKQEMMLFGSGGKAIRFHEDDVRAMGRTACGVRGIKLGKDQQVIALAVIEDAENETVLLATENGYGKRTAVTEFSVQKRGGQGVIGIQTDGRNGKLVGAVLVHDADECMLITNGGTLVRTPVADISVIGRNTKGVTLIRLTNEEKLVEIESIGNLGGDMDEESGGEEGSAEPEIQH